MNVDIWKSKARNLVDVIGKDGTVSRGYVFCASDERVLDVITSVRQFLPFEREDGHFSIISKNLIARVVPIERGMPVRVSTCLEQAPVEVHLVDGCSFMGKVFLTGHMRIIDVMNSELPFVPIENQDGELEILNKTIIAVIDPAETRAPRPPLALAMP